MRLFSVAAAAAFVCSVPLCAQSRTPKQVLPGVFPPSTNTAQFTLTGDAQRSYYLTDSGDVWVFDRAKKTGARVTTGNPWDISVSPTRNAIAYTKGAPKSKDGYVWVAPLDPVTGLPAGAERRLSAHQGDVPSISPDGKLVAFARDDSSGVGQSIVVVPVEGGAERVVAAALPSSVDNIRWTPDGKSLYIGVNPLVACVPDWSCLPITADTANVRGTIRRVSLSGGAPTVVATGKLLSPGLSPDGTMIVYMDTGAARRVVVADADGKRLDSFVLPATQVITGWLSGSTLLVKESGIVRRTRSVTVANGKSRVLYETSDNITDAAWSRDSKSFAVVRCANGNPPQCELRLFGADGVLQKTHAIPGFFAAVPQWSPDGKWIGYLSYLQDKPVIAVTELATGKTTNLADARQGAAPSLVWLADSKGVVVTDPVQGGGPDRHVSFRQIDLEGKSTTLRDIVVGATPATAVAVDATSAIVFRGPLQVYAMTHLTGDGSERAIVSGLSGLTAPPVFSADRAWMAIKRNPTGTDNSKMNSVELMHVDGAARRTVELQFGLATGSANPMILPGGREFIAVEFLRPDVDPGVYLVTAGTNTVKQLFTYPRRSTRGPPEFSLSPDGKTLLYSNWEALTTTVSTMDLSPLKRSR